jgi:hypothetical protein
MEYLFFLYVPLFLLVGHALNKIESRLADLENKLRK